MADVSQPSRAQRIFGTIAVLIDACFVAALAEPVFSPGRPSFFGWTPQSLLVISIARLVYLVVLFLSGCTGAVREGCCSLISNTLEVLFPYVFSVLYGAVFVVRLISDLPATVHSNDSSFWTLAIVGILCSVLETYTTLEVQRWSSQQRAEGLRNRQATSPGTGAAGEGLNLELLENGDGAGVSSSGRARPADGSSSSLSHASSSNSLGTSSQQQDREKKKDSADEEKLPAVSKLLSLVLPDWPLLIQACIFLILAAITEAYIPKFVGEAITKIVTAEEQGRLAERPFKGPIIKLLVTAFACGLCSSCRGATFIMLGSRVSVRLRQDLFDNLLRQDIGFFDTTKTGEITSRLTQDCQKVSDQVQLNVNVFLRTVVQTITTLIFMTSVSHPLTYVAFVSVPVIVVLSKKYGAFMSQLSQQIQNSLAEANAVAQEGLSTMSTLRSFAGEEMESQRFGAKLAVFGRHQRRQARFYVGYMASVVFLPQSVTSLVLFYGGKLALEGSMKAEGLVSFVFYLQTLNNNFSTLGDFYTNMMTALGAASRAFELRERLPNLPLDPVGPPVPTTRVEGCLKLEGLRFNYPARPEIEVLKGFSLEIPAGKVVSLVGPSGNGKSTIIGLLQRLYKQKEGTILLDGTDIWDFSHHDFHRTISIVGQEPVLYARTIRENIVFGIENPPLPMRNGRLPTIPPPKIVSDEEVFAASQKANAHNFIRDLPEGYDTQVGERGVSLSGGQKQRIAIARALVRKPKVLLLDEATSALDAESERLVQQAIDGMIAEGSMTVIIIAHRLSTVRNSHKICVVQQGLVIEEGTHDDLVAKQGPYFRLVQCQLAEPNSPTGS
mmetsp:Transcript_75261/g.156779  ORF Transcript_75261/g.156779 Transcript_75261/m.156779 type:complete len:837 (+) Transcript_75261:55-2565(+)|eukprot:CAMPEP_0206438010 /NCGR_PEP_ID=MMETSP0324_2-20121206/11367_1 /ASSEMBLY_ACC=CAM_ASM_000836 /TAXON_ID=2866 /ORGANISM="Crypthecodinium cohnii, Strain Seligo" /LENGTH=836 /DNA_ID=CAMNT_0053905371 /DNA_START=26 /DNA_END=2536 /DNA_ORIENTATION=+